jgi:class 3 adenylate cyclase/tetratricopeptide (TPR) repeat protein
VAESVELATILLTDLVGSTRLATSVGPARADQLREEHFGLLRDAIGAYEGKEVKNTGDGLMVAFPSASAAVKCAVSVQQLFERRYRRAEQRLHIRIGLGAGESTVKDGDHFGMPSIEAARLCAKAPPDGILISGLARALAGRCEGVGFVPAAALELKGFPEPMEAFSVSWTPLGEEASRAGRWPLPAVLRTVPPVSYVGRVEERALIEEALGLARGGQRQVVLLTGEPGIGKTRLSSYTARRAHGEGFVVCWGACSEELAAPYEPWIEVCTQLIEHAPVDLLERHCKRHGGELSRFVRSLGERVQELPEPQTSDPETERYLLFSAVSGLLKDVAQSLPVCMVLDDMHWADGQSVALLKHLIRTVEHGALQVIATYRDSDLGKDHPLSPLLADVRAIGAVQRVALRGLGVDEVAQMVSAVAGHELEEDGLELARKIAEETDGNPFFVGEILRGLSESGALVFDESLGRWSVDRTAGIALPESVREVIERRVERLGVQVLEVLRVAAVVGRVFDVQLLESILGDEGTLLDHLEAAVASSLLSESSERVGQFRFAHALINQTLYDGIGATRRARIHQRVAEALEEICGDDPGDRLSELALHWRMAAVSVDKVRAAAYALRAGQRALEGLAPAEAVKLFGDAVELTGDDDSTKRCEALIGLGEAQRQTGEGAYRETLLEASRIASALADAEFAARAALANSRGYTSVIGEIDEHRLEAIDRAIELDDPPRAARRARLFALKALELTWDPDFTRRRTLADEAIAQARVADDARTLAEVLPAAIRSYESVELVERRSRLVKDLVDCAAAVRDPALQALAYDLESDVEIELGEFSRAQTARDRMLEIAEELGQPTLRWFATWHAAAAALLRGDLAIGESLVERAFAIGQEAGEPDAVMIYGAQLAFVRTYQGRGEEIIAMLEQGVSNFPAISVWRAGLASALCWVDRKSEAWALLEQAASDGFERVSPDPAQSSTLALYADAAVQTGHVEAASTLHDLIEPWSDRIVWSYSMGYGHARTYLGMLAALLGAHEKADQHLRFACEFHETNGLPLWAARARLGWADALAKRGEMSRAREHATRALELSREHGYTPFEARAAALLGAVHSPG